VSSDVVLITSITQLRFPLLPLRGIFSRTQRLPQGFKFKPRSRMPIRLWRHQLDRVIFKWMGCVVLSSWNGTVGFCCLCSHPAPNHCNFVVQSAAVTKQLYAPCRNTCALTGTGGSAKVGLYLASATDVWLNGMPVFSHSHPLPSGLLLSRWRSCGDAPDRSFRPRRC